MTASASDPTTPQSALLYNYRTSQPLAPPWPRRPGVAIQGRSVRPRGQPDIDGRRSASRCRSAESSEVMNRPRRSGCAREEAI